MSDVVWAKVYLELPTDPKLVGRSAHDCYLWVCLILLAKANDDQPGTIPAWQSRAAYLAKYARISLREATAALAYFEDVGMIATTPDGTLTLLHFPKRQSKVDPTATQRQRDKRARDRDSNGDVTRDSHATRAREEADRNPIGLLTEAEAEAEAEAAPEDGGVCVDKEALAAFREEFGPAPANHSLREAAGPRTEREAHFATFRSEWPPNPDGNPWNWHDAGRAWNEQVPPSSEEACLAKARLYAESPAVKRGRVMAPANWLPSWREQKEPAPVAAEPTYTKPGERRPDGKIQVAI